MSGVDLGRLTRAARLRVRDLGNGRYDVTGGAEPHRVTFPSATEYAGSAYAVWCDCEDFSRGMGLRACKHVLAVAIVQATDEDRAEIAAMLGIE